MPRPTIARVTFEYGPAEEAVSREAALQRLRRPHIAWLLAAAVAAAPLPLAAWLGVFWYALPAWLLFFVRMAWHEWNPSWSSEPIGSERPSLNAEVTAHAFVVRFSGWDNYHSGGMLHELISHRNHLIVILRAWFGHESVYAFPLAPLEAKDADISFRQRLESLAANPPRSFAGQDLSLDDLAPRGKEQERIAYDLLAADSERLAEGELPRPHTHNLIGEGFGLCLGIIVCTSLWIGLSATEYRFVVAVSAAPLLGFLSLKAYHFLGACWQWLVPGEPRLHELALDEEGLRVHNGEYGVSAAWTMISDIRWQDGFILFESSRGVFCFVPASAFGWLNASHAFCNRARALWAMAWHRTRAAESDPSVQFRDKEAGPAAVETGNPYQPPQGEL